MLLTLNTSSVNLLHIRCICLILVRSVFSYCQREGIHIIFSDFSKFFKNEVEIDLLARSYLNHYIILDWVGRMMTVLYI